MEDNNSLLPPLINTPGCHNYGASIPAAVHLLGEEQFLSVNLSSVAVGYGVQFGVQWGHLLRPGHDRQLYARGQYADSHPVDD